MTATTPATQAAAIGSRTSPAWARFRDADAWLAAIPPHPGSWWPKLAGWLEGHYGTPVAPPPTGAPDGGFPLWKTPLGLTSGNPDDAIESA